MALTTFEQGLLAEGLAKAKEFLAEGKVEMATITLTFLEQIVVAPEDANA